MSQKLEVLAVIMARLNSKGVPQKCIRPLAGRPLIAHTIDAALGASSITRTIVTTESPEIADIARLQGAEVPFMRPAVLSNDNVQVNDVVDHALSELKMREGYVPDVVVMLQPTSPMRTAEDIGNAMELFVETQADEVISVTATETHPYWTVVVDEKGIVSSFVDLPATALEVGRQDLPVVYKLNGAIYITRPQGVIQMASHPYSGKTHAYIMPPERSIDINTEMDFRIAEALFAESGKRSFASVRSAKYGSALE